MLTDLIHSSTILIYLGPDVELLVMLVDSASRLLGRDALMELTIRLVPLMRLSQDLGPAC